MNREPIPVALSWSGGKDSAMALHTLRESTEYEVRVLVTTVTDEYDRISIHGVRRSLLEAQAQSLGLPLEIALIPPLCSNDEYERSFGAALTRCTQLGIETLAAGDLFLEDVRDYRENFAARYGMSTIFPIWGVETLRLAQDFIALGFEAILTCVDTWALENSFVGRNYDAEFLADLPAKTDSCGENGEFHTYVWSGPIFSRPIDCKRGDIVIRDERFAYCDLLPA